MLPDEQRINLVNSLEDSTKIPSPSSFCVIRNLTLTQVFQELREGHDELLERPRQLHAEEDLHHALYCSHYEGTSALRFVYLALVSHLGVRQTGT